MALTPFLFKVCQFNVEKNKHESSTTDVADEHSIPLSAKVIFRGTRRARERERVSRDRCSSLRINLWSNNVPLHDGTASFIARGDRPKKFTFHLATMLMADDRVRLEFYVIKMKKKRKKLVDRSETSRSAQFSSFSEDDHDDGGHRHRYVDSKHHRAL
jgi:hypothetical protein